MIDALFGSKTRVKLLHLFMNNPGKAFYVREITRLIDEQINSVRRELANMMKVGIVKSDSADNKLYYEVNQRYEHYVPLRAIFADDKSAAQAVTQTKAGGQKIDDLSSRIEALGHVRLAIIAGLFVPQSSSAIDLLIVGSPAASRVDKLVTELESGEGRELNYTVMPYDEFYYRLSVRDRFITDILSGKHSVLLDTDGLLESRGK